jgi:glucose 1-dehydrogenase
MPSKGGLIASGQHRHRHSSEEMTMKAITVVPGKPEQVQVSDLPDPQPEPATLLVPGRLLGICATDADIVENGYGLPPPGHDRLVIG